MTAESAQSFDPLQAREFATDVVRTLRDAGYEAYWAGGCVRDDLLGKQPKDYDVTTNAEPQQVRDVFGKRRTLPIGAAFGVITVLGTKRQGQIEVATFRKDAEYSDGRHPDGVVFTNAREDALRRDFTINGMFYDPIEEVVLDYVGGQVDLEEKRIRAIGDPKERINEDKLRMLRAVRFAGTLNFQLDPGTLAAVQAHADELKVVSAERITQELRRMLAHANRAQAIGLLQESLLMPVVLPELNTWTDEGWARLTKAYQSPALSQFTEAFALLLYVNGVADNGVNNIGVRLRMSNDEQRSVRFVASNVKTIHQAVNLPWHVVQRILIQPDASELLAAAQALCDADDAHHDSATFCREKLALAPEELNPAPFVTGADLKKLNLRPGPMFRTILDTVRNLQLDGQILTKEDALQKAAAIAEEDS